MLLYKNQLVLQKVSLKSLPIQFIYEIIGLFSVLLVLRFLLVEVFKLQKRKKYLNSGITTVDTMKGVEFENFLLANFETLGYKGWLTNKSHDYGADLLLKKDHEIIVIQAKRYGSSKVGIKAIQELVASLQYYKANKGIVVTNNYFTSNANDLAAANSIELWDRDKLTGIMLKNGSKDLADQTLTNTINSKVCPDCGSHLILKGGKYGIFYGCTNYPKCHFTRNC